jgi:hypothetical protein
MKKLYEFTVSKETEVDKVEKTKNEKGEDVTITKKVKELTPYKFFVKKATRSINDQAELYNGSKVSEAIKAGFLTVVQLRKRFENDGGTVSDPSKMQYLNWMKELFDLQNEFLKLNLNTNRNAEQEKEYSDTLRQINEIRENMRQFELYQSSLFEQTAETYARNRIILWYTLFLSYKVNEKGEEVPFFDGADLDEKLAAYDNIEEQENEFDIMLVKKFLLLITLWYTGGATSKEDFDNLLKNMDTTEETPSEPAPTQQTNAV